MNPAKFLVIAAFLIVLAMPFAVRSLQPGESRPSGKAGSDSLSLIVVTPHVEQIRSEFAEAFSAWHRRHHGEGVRIDWRAVGGTSEILKLLEAQYGAALRNGQIRIDDDGRPVAPPGTISFDLMFGGGSFEHGRLKRGISHSFERKGNQSRVNIPMSIPAGFDQAYLDEIFGENRIGGQQLYDPEQYWIGTALSGFGIVFNRDVLRQLGLDEPAAFRDLADPRYAGMLALADPRQSGSVTTTYESILNKEGWDQGWRILRELCANSRYYASASTRPPVDVAQGDAAAGLAIDFYGRGQAQIVMRPGETPETCRVGYVDPKGAVYIDADPASLLLGGPNPELARRFVEFSLTPEAQALWQMHARSGPNAASNPIGEDGEPMGPRRYELRRIPVRRSMFEPEFMRHYVDKSNPFELASPMMPRGWRDAIAPMMGAFGIDTAAEQRAAWRHLSKARELRGFPAETLAEMERLFYAMPVHRTQDGRDLEFNEENYRAISDDTSRWRDPVKSQRARIGYTGFFRENYRDVSDLWRLNKDRGSPLPK